MKKLSKILALSVLGVFLLAGTAMALNIDTYDDIYANWPGHEVDSRDVIGTPSVGDMAVTTTDGWLNKITIEVSERRVWDSLFINADWNGVYSDYETWDYYVIDKTLAGNGTLSAVSDGYDYLYAIQPEPSTDGRWGHPSGIDPDYLTFTSGLSSVVWDGAKLTYTFDGSSINIGAKGEYVIGYSMWCANDVFLTPVPEPLTILLLGFGLLGLGLARRKS